MLLYFYNMIECDLERCDLKEDVLILALACSSLELSTDQSINKPVCSFIY